MFHHRYFNQRYLLMTTLLYQSNPERKQSLLDFLYEKVPFVKVSKVTVKQCTKRFFYYPVEGIFIYDDFLSTIETNIGNAIKRMRRPSSIIELTFYYTLPEKEGNISCVHFISLNDLKEVIEELTDN